MIHLLKTNKITKPLASYLAIQMLLITIQPSKLFALTGGPAQPEFNSFTPIGTSDMVNLSSGDFNYNIPIMDVGGYPLNLAYDSGITMDQEASWVGLGWNLNVGQINRQVRGIPDDFKGDPMRYENDMRTNQTVGADFGIQGALVGFPNFLSVSSSLGVQYNNYEGITFNRSFGVAFDLGRINAGLTLSGSTTGGAVVSPNVSFSRTINSKNGRNFGISGGSAGLSISSRKGLETLTLKPKFTKSKGYHTSQDFKLSGTISFNNNNIYTPYKRAGMVSNNFSFNGALGTEILGGELQGHLTGYSSSQRIRNSELDKLIPAYGYAYHEFADHDNSVLDFNRENDRSFSKNTTILPIGNHTYDIYSLQGQGFSGQFRPHRSQVSYLSDNRIVDLGDGRSGGGEFGVGWNAHGGFDSERTKTFSSTGGWVNNNFALNRFVESGNDNNDPLYEDVYYKMIGEPNVDAEPHIYENEVHSTDPVRFQLGGSKHNRTLLPKYQRKEIVPNGGSDEDDKIKYNEEPINGKIKRSARELRNTGVFKVAKETAAHDPFVTARPEAIIPDHHTAGMSAIKPDGSRYIYGETAYNWEKKEITVDVSGSGGVDYKNGTILNTGMVKTSSGSDGYKNIITTPPYAHTYLLSSVLSADYEDLTNNGPSTDDLGSYTKFNYGNASNAEDHPEYYVADYNWRTPYESNKANFNEGLKSLPNDEKGSIIEGRKELKYIRTIETKTHVAYFKLSKREDARGANGSDDHMKQLDKIFLYTEPEYRELVATHVNLDDLDINNPEDLITLSRPAIKVAHFEYDYILGPGVPNSDAANSARLTLKETYFTYRGSNMGQYTPYIFNYDGFNPSYSLKGYDIWGNYKSNEEVEEVIGDVLTSRLTTSEFPFVEQNKEEADQNNSAWLLTSIDMPSGGRLDIETEADDYQYVQDKKAMQMFKIHGFGGVDPLLDSGDFKDRSSNELYQKSAHKEYIHVKISDDPDYPTENFEKDYLEENINKPIYFRTLLNMTEITSSKYDYVSGYFEIDKTRDFGFAHDDSDTQARGTYVAIPMETLDLEGGLNGGRKVNPIAKAGWYFGRSNLNRVVYTRGGEPVNDDIISIINELRSSLESIFEIFRGPNAKLEENQIAKRCIPSKSWIRLENPIGRKYGGGVRVSKIQLHDNWDVMTAMQNSDNSDLYRQFYGQEYDYNLEDGTSSGVAAYEPNGSKENPLVEPFYDTNDKLVAPKEFNYTEKPFGESFFPSAGVTYSRVTVKNLQRVDDNRAVRKHATGRVVTEFYTCKDFPTISDYTDIRPEFDPPGALGSILNLSVKNHLTFTQGFVVEANDMNGRMKSQNVFAEDQVVPISGVDYFYNTDEDGKLSSTVKTINKKGVVSDNEIGLTYDVFNDFRENYSESTTVGGDSNVAAFLLFIFPSVIPTLIPVISRHETLLRTASTTKVIHRSAIMTKKVARDLGSSVSTEYLAWDAHTGQTLLTETVNEYDDHYYNFTYPVHWYYDGMDMASINQGATGILTKDEDTFHYNYLASTSESIFRVGDELLTYPTENSIQTEVQRMWIADVRGGEIQLMDADGHLIAYDCATDELIFQIVRSGYRNQQTGSMASVTSQRSPLVINPTAALVSNRDEYKNIGDRFSFNPQNSSPGGSSAAVINPRIVNASAVAYHEGWPLQWESNLPPFPEGLVGPLEELNYETPEGNNAIDPVSYGFNPYLHNVRGEWRAKRSYAFLSGRNVGAVDQEVSPRYQGYFSQFNPFYSWNGDQWSADTTDWTFASEVTEYSPYGAELENRDALGRFSAAQYGYNYTLPTAVASNSAYEQIGFDGFEDYSYQTVQEQENDDQHFGFITGSSNNASRTEITAHTGRYSLKVIAPVSLKRDYTNEPFPTPFNTVNCNVLPPATGNCGITNVEMVKENCDTRIYSFGVSAHINVVTIEVMSDNCNNGNSITHTLETSTFEGPDGTQNHTQIGINSDTALQDCFNDGFDLILKVTLATGFDDTGFLDDGDSFNCTFYIAVDVAPNLNCE